MTKTDKIIKEFYCQYGFLMHNAQILESGLLELYALKRYVNENLTELDYYEMLTNRQNYTLGQLNKLLFKLNFLDSKVEDNLTKANKIRNFLAHRFWWERDITFENLNGLVKLHDEILTYVDFFQNIMNSINYNIQKIRDVNNLNIEAKMGLTDFKVRENFIKKLRSSND